jgi:hypothetical protein
MTRGPYKARAWEPIRRMVLQRDNYRCQIRGRRCLGSANEVDHIVPVIAGGALFDPANLRAACRPCNAGRVSAEKAENGWRRGPTHITLVWGPPGAGKTTYVDKHRQPGDLVVDFDAIAESFGSSVTHGHDDGIASAASAARNAVLRQLRRGESKATHAWIISANPKAVAMFPHHAAVLIDPGQEQVLAQAERAGRPDLWLQLISDWYSAPVDATPSRREW